MRTHDNPLILGPGNCAAGCQLVWEKWCRGCNLVFCANHADPVFHKCRSLTVPEPTAEIPLVVPIKPPGRKRKDVLSVEEKQAELPLDQPPAETE